MRTFLLVALLLLGLACTPDVGASEPEDWWDVPIPFPTPAGETPEDAFERLYEGMRAERTLPPVPPEPQVDDLLIRIRQLERELYNLSREVDTLTQRHYIEDMRY